MKVIGIDAGFTAPGFAVVDFIDDSFSLLGSNVVSTTCVVTERSRLNRSVSADDAHRIIKVVTALDHVFDTHKPSLATIELPFGGAMSSGAMKGMGMATAMAVSVTSLHRVPMALISPRENKRRLTGSSTASKETMVEACERIWTNIPWPLKVLRNKVQTYPDTRMQEAVADALATIVAYVKWPEDVRAKNTIY